MLDKQRRRHPAARKARLAKTEDVVRTAEAVLAGRTMLAAAAENRVAVDSRPVRELVAKARERFLRRLDDCVDALVTAAQVAAQAGDPEPAKWALEHMEFEGERVITPPDAAPVNPGLRIGIAIGGLPQAPAQQPADMRPIETKDLPVLEVALPEELMP